LAYTTGALVTKVQLRVRDTGYDSTEIKNYLNDTQNDVFNEYRLPFMEATQDYTLTVGVSDITNGSGLPTDFSQAIDLYITTANKEKVLVYRDFREIDRLYPDPDDTTKYVTAEPEDYYRYGQTFKTRPVADLAYTATLRYYKKPTILSDDANVPSLPSEFEELLVVGAAYRVLQVKNQYAQAGVLENKYRELLDKLVVKSSVAQVGSPTVMRINRRALGKTSF